MQTRANDIGVVCALDYHRTYDTECKGHQTSKSFHRTRPVPIDIQIITQIIIGTRHAITRATSVLEQEEGPSWTRLSAGSWPRRA